MPSSHSSSSHSSFSGGSSFGSSSFSSPSYHSSSSHSSYSSGSYYSHGGSAKHFHISEGPTPGNGAHARYRDDSWMINTWLLHQMLYQQYLFREDDRKYSYRYYPRDFTDKHGRDNKAGYYNEESGKRYDNLVMPGIRNIVTCPSCHEQFYHTWETCSVPSEVRCPNCYHEFVVSDIENGDLVKQSEKKTLKARLSDAWDEFKVALGIFVVLGIFIGLCFATFTMAKNGTFKAFSREKIYSNISIQSNKYSVIYAEPIGREVSFDGENYYDPESGMYFWYNTTVSPAQWQYWYGPISEQYGDYGWMEYDSSQEQWYIETYSGNWVTYDGDTSALWHFEDAHQSPASMAVTNELDPETQDLVLVTDEISYFGLTPNKVYVITTTVTDEETGTAIATTQTEITPAESSGNVTVTLYVPSDAGSVLIKEEISAKD